MKTRYESPITMIVRAEINAVLAAVSGPKTMQQYRLGDVEGLYHQNGDLKLVNDEIWATLDVQSKTQHGSSLWED